MLTKNDAGDKKDPDEVSQFANVEDEFFLSPSIYCKIKIATYRCARCRCSFPPFK